MVFGGTLDERIQFNEDTLWTGKPHDYVRAGSGDALPEVRRLLAEGKIKDAENLARTKVLSDPVRQKAYQPFGDLRLHFPGHEKPAAYRRELDLDAAVARASYQVDGVTYTREVIASYPDNVIAVRLTASQPGALNFTLRMDSPHNSAVVKGGTRPPDGLVGDKPGKTGPEARFHQDDLILTGQIQPDGLRFESRVRLLATGGTVRNEGTTLIVEHANSATLLLVAATSFKTYEDISADPSQRCADYFTKLEARDFAALLARHTTDHQRLFRRVSLVLQNKADPSSSIALAKEDLPTDQRLRLVKTAGTLDADPALAALEFQYGRYLLIASSRPGTQPANLQGIWNPLLDPPWESKWTTNINAEMNYWPAELTNLSECHEPLFDLIGDLAVSGARTAQSLYHSRGWVLHHNTDLWRGTAPINNIDGLWPTGGAWLCWHLWEHWLFTGDRDFLARRAYPVMKSASLFFVDSLVRDEKTGWLVTNPSFSPEQGTLCAGPTMDNQLIRSLWQTTRDAARLLAIDSDFVAELEKLLPQLPPNQIGKHGQLQEWLEDVDVPNNNHRHQSPLWALYPGADITPADPKVFAAAKKLLTWRGGGSTGWSFAWRIPLWARVGDGDYAYSQLSLLMAKRTLPNLFDLCGPFQIDGNFGATAGIAEMLLQSHQRGETPNAKLRMPNSQNPDPKPQTQNPRPETLSSTVIIDLLHALPKAWSTGSVTGLCARDGFEIDLAWQDGTLTRAVIRSKLGRPCEIRYAGQSLKMNTLPGQSAAFDTHLRTIK